MIDLEDLKTELYILNAIDEGNAVLAKGLLEKRMNKFPVPFGSMFVKSAEINLNEKCSQESESDFWRNYREEFLRSLHEFNQAFKI
jgi:hypothetical protein